MQGIFSPGNDDRVGGVPMAATDGGRRTVSALQIAIDHYQVGRLTEAEAICRRILTGQPGHADTLHLLGVIAHRVGRDAVAVDLIRRAITVNPAASPYYISLGSVLMNEGQFEEAIAVYRRVLSFAPELADAHHHLGAALQRTRQLDEAIAAYRRALHLKSDDAMAHNNLGSALKDQGQLGEAIVSYRRALQLDRDFAMAHNNLGNALKDQGRLDQAIAEYRKALEVGARAGIGYRADDGRLKHGRRNEAVIHYNLGCALANDGQVDEAITSFRRALEIQPHMAMAYSNLGNALLDRNGHDEALVCYRSALHLQPASSTHSSILAALHYCPGTTLKSLRDAHAEYERLHAAPLRAQWRVHQNARNFDRPLRLGFVSPHFAFHAVGRFLIRPLEHLDRGEFQVFCYSDTRAADAMTSRIRAAASEWRDVSAMTDVQLDESIRADGIDILFDLAGHTPGDRLQVFARKPAPIQITWLDYVGTTGLSAMDYLLADGREIPWEAEAFYREKVLRMPDDYICYDPPADAPSVEPLPVIANGHVTFGCFNIPHKITAQMVAVWARILHAVPHSRLMLKNVGFDAPETLAHYRRMFGGLGIAPDRLELIGWSPPGEVLGCYNGVDVALDTFPYNGGLTTCEAMWMGVPVVTCSGETFASRHGLSHLAAVGATETIAGSLDEYVEIAVKLATDPLRMTALRAGLRNQMAASPLCDGRRFAENLAVLLRAVCGGDASCPRPYWDPD